MSSLAIAVAERLERGGGPRTGLFAWKAVAGSASDDRVRGQALLAAMRCALSLRDDAALGELVSAWGSVAAGSWDAAIAALCRSLSRAGLLSRATALAGEEARRRPTALALYTFARCLDVARDPSAAEAFRRAIARADDEGARRLATAGRVRRAAILSRSVETVREAVREARLVDLALASPADKLVVARALLRSPSRFVRAGAIALLDEAVLGEDDALASRALGIAARWVDDVGRGALTPLEADRLIAMFGRERVTRWAADAKATMIALAEGLRAETADEVEAALARAARLQPELAARNTRAREILSGRLEAPRDLAARPPEEARARRALRHEQALDVLVALRDGATARAAHALRALAEAREAGELLPRAAFAVAHEALSASAAGERGSGGALEGELRRAAARLVAALLRAAPTARPPRGFLALADTLAAVGEVELAMVARRAAVAAGEPSAAEALSTSLARAGWELAGRGRAHRAEAIAALREAKAIAEAG